MTSIWQLPPETTDVAIVGGGLTGVSIAYALAERGIDCCLLERERLAAGASGRNDGQVILDTVDFYPDMKQQYGEAVAKRMLRFKRMGQESMDAAIAAANAAELMSYHRAGSLNLAINDAEARKIEAAVAEMNRDGYPVELVERDRIESLIQTRRFAVGKWDRRDASVNPAALTRWIGAEALRRGAGIYEGVAARSVSPGLVVHEHGELRCEIAIMAVNAYAPQMSAEFESYVFPHRGQVLATAPTDIRIEPLSCIANFGYDYWHWTADGRLIIGGARYRDEHAERGFDSMVNPKVQAGLEELIRDFYPQFADRLTVARRWAGIMGFSRDGLPIIGPVGGDPALWCAIGFTGYGLGLCWAVGVAIADTLDGRDSEFAEILPTFAPSRFS